MGGRGASGGGRSGSVGSSTAVKKQASGGKSASIKIPAFTKASISKMNRSGLETLATAIFANRATSQGLSIQEGIHRAKSLMSGNTTAQLRKYVLKYGKK